MILFYTENRSDVHEGVVGDYQGVTVYVDGKSPATVSMILWSDGFACFY